MDGEQIEVKLRNHKDQPVHVVVKEIYIAGVTGRF